MTWKWDILNQYALHLYNEHRNDENFDTSLEHKIMNDWLTHSRWADGATITVACDHVDCYWHRKFNVMYTVTPLEEEE